MELLSHLYDLPNWEYLYASSFWAYVVVLALSLSGMLLVCMPVELIVEGPWLVAGTDNSNLPPLPELFGAILGC